MLQPRVILGIVVGVIPIDNRVLDVSRILHHPPPVVTVVVAVVAQPVIGGIENTALSLVAERGFRSEEEAMIASVKRIANKIGQQVLSRGIYTMSHAQHVIVVNQCGTSLVNPDAVMAAMGKAGRGPGNATYQVVAYQASRPVIDLDPAHRVSQNIEIDVIILILHGSQYLLVNVGRPYPFLVALDVVGVNQDVEQFGTGGNILQGDRGHAC